jgi:tripartite-type tricarboxylate transporter receptor subunit TctC
MHAHRRRWLARFGALSLPLTRPSAARAQDRAPWPVRPVKLIVGFTPGNASDVVARLYAEELGKQFNQPFIVENRPGAGGTLAVESFVRNRDDHQLLFGSSTLIAAAPNLYPALKYDTLKDLDTVALMGRTPLVLVVRPDFPARTFAEFLAHAKSASLSFGSSGNGAMNHLATELLQHRAGLKMTHVPYKGSAQAMTDLLGGQINVLFDTTTAVLPHVQANRLRPLAVSTAARLAELPEVPTVAETFAGYEAVTWAAFCVNAGTPAAITQRLGDAVNAVTRLPNVQARLLATGTQPIADSTPASSRAYWHAEYAKYGELVRRVGIRLE